MNIKETIKKYVILAKKEPSFRNRNKAREYFKEHGIALSTLLRHMNFETHAQFLSFYNIQPLRRRNMSKRFLLNELRRFFNETGNIPTYELLQSSDDFPSSSTYVNRFGSFDIALRKAGFESNINFKKKTSTEEINKLIKCMLIAFIVNAIYIFIAIDLNEILLAGQRVGAENINENWNANSIGIFSALGSMLSLYFVQKQNNKIINIVLFLSFIMFTFLCLLSGSRKGLLLFIMLNGLFLFLLTKNKLIISLVILLSVSILYYLLMNIDILYNIIGKRMQNMIEGFFGLGTSENSFNIRQDMIEKGFQFFSQKPILGYGINNFRNLYDINTYAHNNFIELLVGIGLVGFTVYYIAYAYVLCKLFKTTFIKPNRLSIIAFVINTCFLISHYAFVGYYDIINTLTILLGFLIIQLNKGTAHEKNFKQSNKRY